MKSIFKGIQHQTGHTVDFQEKAFAESVRFMSGYNQILNSLTLKKIVQVAEEYEIPSGTLSDAELIEHIIDTEYYEQKSQGNSSENTEKSADQQPAFNEGGYEKKHSHIKLKAFANAAVCIKHFFTQSESPEILDEIDLEDLSQQMCSPLLHEMNLSDDEWGLLERHVLGFMVIVRNLEEIHTQSIPELFDFYITVSFNIASSIVDGHLDLGKMNTITHNYCQKTMDKLRAIGESHGYYK